jgi:hypothetical protein
MVLKCFIALVPNVIFTKLSSSSLTKRQNKLECFFLASLSSPVLYLQTGSQNTLQLLHSRVGSCLGWKGLSVTNGLAYLASSSVTKEKKFYVINTMSLTAETCEKFESFPIKNFYIFFSLSLAMAK